MSSCCNFSSNIDGSMRFSVFLLFICWACIILTPYIIGFYLLLVIGIFCLLGLITLLVLLYSLWTDWFYTKSTLFIVFWLFCSFIMLVLASFFMNYLCEEWAWSLILWMFSAGLVTPSTAVPNFLGSCWIYCFLIKFSCFLLVLDPEIMKSRALFGCLGLILLNDRFHSSSCTEFSLTSMSFSEPFILELLDSAG